MRSVIRSSLPREIKDSLNYCWKEGVAAQVMISIFDYYLIPYGLFIGATTQEIGLLVGIPNILSSVSQLFAVRAVAVAGSRQRLLLSGIGLQALFLVPLVFLPFIHSSYAVLLLICLISLFRLLGGLIGPAWGSLVSHYLPEDQRGQYIGWRARMVAISGIISMAFWGVLLYLIKGYSQKTGFILIFAGAVVSRFISYYLTGKMADVPLDHTPRSGVTLTAFLRRFHESNFAKFILFVVTITFATQLSQPYFSVHMLKDLQFNYLSYISVQLASVIAGIIIFPVWGRNADITGNARIIKSTGICLPFIPVLWSMARTPYELIGIEILSGFLWSGFSLSTTNFIYDSVRVEDRVRYLSYYNMINGIAVFGGASLGGYLAGRLPALFGFPLGFLFVISALLGGCANLFLARHFNEIRASARKVSSIRLYFSIIGIRPLAGVDTELDIYPPIRPPREKYAIPSPTRKS